MRTAQLIKVTEKTIFLNNGVDITENLSEFQKMEHIISGRETNIIKNEQVVDAWEVKTIREADKIFFAFLDKTPCKNGEYYTVKFIKQSKLNSCK